MRIVSAYHGPISHIAPAPAAKAAAPSSPPTSVAFAVPFALIRSNTSKIADFISVKEPSSLFILSTKSASSVFTIPPTASGSTSCGIQDSLYDRTKGVTLLAFSFSVTALSSVSVVGGVSPYLAKIVLLYR
ncbi:hypothetical protein D3C73_1042640 [compost metagenome]